LRIEKITHDPSMTMASIRKISDAGASLWSWVLAMESYAKAFKDIEPKRAKVNSLKEKLAKSEDELKLLQEKF
jgi:dynein heavy chain